MLGVRGDPESARFINRSLVLGSMKSGEVLSRAELARQLRLSKVTISQVVADLISEGLVEETGDGGTSSTGGRRPRLIRVVSSGPYVIGLDIGLTNTVVALAGLDGTRIEQFREPTDVKHDAGSILAQIETLTEAILAKRNVPRTMILGVGISIGGLIDGGTGYIAFSPDFGWEELPFRGMVEQRLGLPTILDNCTRAMALGENWHEKSYDTRNIFYVNVGHGIGSAIVMHGRIYNNNSEFGHIRITNRDVLCDCGKRGCLEAVASGHAIEKLAAAAQDAQVSAARSAKEVAMLASAGNATPLGIFRDASRYLGRALSIAATLFNPDRVVIAGGVASARHLLEEPLMDEYTATTMDVIKNSTVVTFSSYGMDAGINGAICLALDRFVFHGEAAIVANST